MTKTYSSKSNAQRAAKGIDGATVAQNAAGAWIVTVPNNSPVVVAEAEVAARFAIPAPPIDLVVEPKLSDAEFEEPVRQIRSDAVEAPVVATAIPVAVQGGFYLRIDGDFDTLSTAKLWAGQVAKKFKTQVTILATATGDFVVTVGEASKAKAPKAPRAPGEPRQPQAARTKPSLLEAKVIEFATAKSGTTREHLTEALKKNAPWTTILKRCAERYGYAYDAAKEGKKTVYRLTK